MSASPADPDALARRCADRMWEGDRASASLGMVLDAVGPGTARLRMAVAPHMLNGVGTCHGGFIFSLADSAFAFACNSGGDKAVASQCSISFLRPAREHEVLVADAARRAEAGRIGLYDVRVSTADGAVVAEFRGQSRTIGTW